MNSLYIAIVEVGDSFYAESNGCWAWGDTSSKAIDRLFEVFP